MNIVFIGSGNVVAVLGRKFLAAGHKIMQIVSRNPSEASSLAYEWDTESANYMSLINKEADIYIIAVADSAIEEVIIDLRLKEKIVVHTAAAVEMDVLKKVTVNYGVFYPLQSLRKEQLDLPETPIYIEAVNESTYTILDKLARSISHDTPSRTANFDKRTKLHVAAVLVNNFTNHILALTENFCQKEGIDFKEMLPLVENTFNRMQNTPPSQTQTGPAIRGDMATVQKHIELLSQYPQLLELYKFLTESIRNFRTN
ncbi:MAG TPA: F420-dependent NADP oxidoreductase [Niabella sp.]|nr:F420-dependent NADP oxidoreductase [Niabella sp.]HOZ96616.1 F420-dependent NADP oxidoreductase [Niabella sp.]HQW14516.1 F420-dependent NADP oxidoreductase [Niabella sp.]HQX19931.1 F420-dependent NADP oxidoreductase [Niabella sp.]HQX41192.1 F420-dependent NADP oxidoreductase [Niabella sp.]